MHLCRYIFLHSVSVSFFQFPYLSQDKGYFPYSGAFIDNGHSNTASSISQVRRGFPQPLCAGLLAVKFHKACNGYCSRTRQARLMLSDLTE